MKGLAQKGKVIFVGAGCGDPELITVKGAKALQSAGVILTDRLVSPDLIRLYASPGANVVYVGKQCRKGASTPQATINELMVLYARDGEQVVRLKGGDVSIFSNILDELETLVAHKIPYEIIPGITAALGAAAAAGMPLTARKLSTAVRFLTAYQSNILPEHYWQELAQTDDTLVFYMSSETLPDVVNQLLLQGIDGNKPLAVIEQATTPFQQVHTCALKEFESRLAGMTFRSPSLVVIGNVVALHEQFKWQENGSQEQEYFQSELLPRNENEPFALTA